MDQVGALPVENALEMILMFSQEGIITYANAAAKEELEYGDELCGSHIGSIFPMSFNRLRVDFQQNMALAVRYRM